MTELMVQCIQDLMTDSYKLDYTTDIGNLLSELNDIGGNRSRKEEAREKRPGNLPGQSLGLYLFHSENEREKSSPPFTERFQNSDSETKTKNQTTRPHRDCWRDISVSIFNKFETLLASSATNERSVCVFPSERYKKSMKGKKAGRNGRSFAEPVAKGYHRQVTSAIDVHAARVTAFPKITGIDYPDEAE
ncbi:hypothetical protein K0M31_008275 [Melipona bicolor]|uniref:Uncharacterized protein n=1 Tax=Melipona bicolor TaxID=60889 RepID=A0AA40FQN4_9HYME|nr:hypothetical protein K0M31_008275 [Melipona bicolor]